MRKGKEIILIALGMIVLGAKMFLEKILEDSD